jgi:hypothetical protein
VLDVGGADLEPALGELHGILELGRPGDGAAPDGVDPYRTSSFRHRCTS